MRQYLFHIQLSYLVLALAYLGHIAKQCLSEGINPTNMGIFYRVIYTVS